MQEVVIQNPTKEQFSSYLKAFEYFNDSLFGGELPGVILNFSRKSKKTLGFFTPKRWQSREGDQETHEISLNPDHFKEDPKDVMSTLVHEMCHLWDQIQEKPPTRCYHSKRWGRKMKEVGLYPSATGSPGGKEVGVKMTHYLIEGGAFDLTYEDMPEEAILPWLSWSPPDKEKKPKNKNKAKYMCECEKAVWAKPGLGGIRCDDCGEAFVQEEAEGD